MQNSSAQFGTALLVENNAPHGKCTAMKSLNKNLGFGTVLSEPEPFSY